MQALLDSLEKEWDFARADRAMKHKAYLKARREYEEAKKRMENLTESIDVLNAIMEKKE